MAKTSVKCGENVKEAICNNAEVNKGNAKVTAKGTHFIGPMVERSSGGNGGKLSGAKVGAGMT